MKKIELIQKVAARLNRPASEVKETVDALLGEIVDAVVQGDSVTLTGFGTFSRIWSPPRRGRHPKSGRLLELHPRFHTRFSAGASFTHRMKSLIPLYDQDPAHLKARRIARTMTEDVRLYHMPLIEEARRKGQPGEELTALLADVRERYQERVPAEVTSARDYLEEELAALLRLRLPPTATGRAEKASPQTASSAT